MTKAYIHTELSDLFFNHDHAARRALYESSDPRAGGPSWDECERAAIEDAESFIRNYPETVKLFDSPDAESLAADFLARV